MQARGPLMIEHRLIERMISLIKNDFLRQIESNYEIEPGIIDTVVDFISMYADRVHHGKEEDILFRDLEEKELSAEDRSIMNGLIDDHALGRRTTKSLAEANNRYRNEDKEALADIADNLKALVELYPRHIEKEDKVFFPASRTYMTDQEEQSMLEEFREFDRKMIREKYESVVEELERS